MVTINEWFKNKDYGIGLVLLAQNCRNRILLQSLSRRKNPAKLEYELGKLRKLEDVVLVVDVVGEVSPPSSFSPPDRTGREGSALDSGEEGVVRNDSPDNLPPELKKLWHFNQDAYKEIRALHEKLKLMANATPEDRQPLTERIASLDDKIRDNWELIDNYDPNAVTLSPELLGKGQQPVIDHKRINANRKFISTNLKKIAAADKSDEFVQLKKAVEARAIELIRNGEMLNKKTFEGLRKAGIEC